jgi:RNA polymerase sigma factor (sigma-70 family)
MRTSESQSDFQALIEEHRRILYKVCNSYCRNPHDREDLAQEIVIELWRSFPTFDEQYRFSTWMYRIALNVAISFYRRESTRTRYLLSDDEVVLNATDESAIESDDIRVLYRLIESLDPFSKALVLLYLDGNSHSEIAESLGITETNVATKIGRLKQAMKRKAAGIERV